MRGCRLWREKSRFRLVSGRSIELSMLLLKYASYFSSFKWFLAFRESQGLEKPYIIWKVNNIFYQSKTDSKLESFQLRKPS